MTHLDLQIFCRDDPGLQRFDSRIFRGIYAEFSPLSN